MEYRTQKARGIAQLANLDGVVSLPVKIVQAEEQVRDSFEWFVRRYADCNTLFARPCPVNPAHGFVDSRPVTSVDEATAVWREAVAADPEAEMVLMPKVNAICNAIYTGNYLALGPGNDGATGGFNSFGFRCVEGVLSPELITAAGIATHKGEVPYIEMVYGHTSIDPTVYPYAVQVRSGPRTEGSDNYIPEDFSVTQVYCPTDKDKADLLHWKNKAVELANIKGLVVWDPNATPAAHIAVHCVDHRIPFLKFNPNTNDSRMPIFGEFFAAQSGDDDNRDPYAMRVGLEIGASMENIEFNEALRVMLFGLHQWQKNRTPVGSKLLGISSALCLRLSIAACLGELRHKRRKSGEDNFFHYERNVVLRRAWSDIFVSQKMMGAALKSFFEGRWNHGYGGKAWGVCAMRAMELWDACIAMYRNPSMEAMVAVSDKLNIATNTIHNGGWQFNKFAPKSVMDEAQNSTPRFMLNSGLGIFKSMTATRPDCSGWVTARKNRSLTEIRKRVNVDEIAQNMAIKAASKLSGSPSSVSSSPASAEKYILLHQEQVAQWDESYGKYLPKAIEEKGKITKIHGYVNVHGSHLSLSKVHFQWKTDKMSGVPYYSIDWMPCSEAMIAALMGLPKDDSSWANGSSSLYFSLQMSEDGQWIKTGDDSHIVICTQFLWRAYFMAQGLGYEVDSEEADSE